MMSIWLIVMGWNLVSKDNDDAHTVRPWNLKVSAQDSLSLLFPTSLGQLNSTGARSEVSDAKDTEVAEGLFARAANACLLASLIVLWRAGT